MGGDINAVDFCIFAWIHGAELATVIQSMQAGDYEQQAILWGAGVPPVVFSLYTTQNIKALLKELKKCIHRPRKQILPFSVTLTIQSVMVEEGFCYYKTPLQTWVKYCLHRLHQRGARVMLLSEYQKSKVDDVSNVMERLKSINNITTWQHHSDSN